MLPFAAGRLARWRDASAGTLLSRAFAAGLARRSLLLRVQLRAPRSCSCGTSCRRRRHAGPDVPGDPAARQSADRVQRARPARAGISATLFDGGRGRRRGGAGVLAAPLHRRRRSCPAFWAWAGRDAVGGAGPRRRPTVGRPDAARARTTASFPARRSARPPRPGRPRTPYRSSWRNTRRIAVAGDELHAVPDPGRHGGLGELDRGVLGRHPEARGRRQAERRRASSAGWTCSSSPRRTRGASASAGSPPW